ncbi:DUF2130 domain-containing protein [Pseudoflavitalea rhizosphaerae]|uniref:DUF2130 domain-containing protein n=1 Tax=Pseudoflavitalea rhizosphaerae TaxID=1884793 RepID=UPI000F8EFCFF|nr:DUF2130 domain-containing protein [Pseudoflavitalea rhizosphaerae]
MAADIKCPDCGHEFAISDALSEDVKKELRDKMKDFVKKKEEEFAKKEDEFQQKEKDWQKEFQQKENEWKREADLQKQAAARHFEEEKLKLQQSLEQDLRKNISADYAHKIQLLENNNKDTEEKLRAARDREINFLKQVEELKDKEAELELTLQRKLLEEKNKLSEELRKQEEQRFSTREADYQFRLKEMEKKLEDQTKLADEMKRKAEQGSMQLQGEIQELALEELLRLAFPFDMVQEVGKGIRGADCIQTVRNNIGQECGKIIYESKRTKHFEKGWIEKLKADMRATQADVAVLVTQAKPEQMEVFGLLDGVWICSYAEVAALTQVLREGILKMYTAVRSQQNRGDKMHLLYDYLTSNEFGEQWKAIREGFFSIRLSIQKERDAMEKLWKAREKQLDKVLLNVAHIKGSIEGIAGSEDIQLNLIDDTPEETEEV